MSNTIIVKYTSDNEDREILNYSFKGILDAKEWLNENTGYFENGDKVCIIDFDENESEFLIIRLTLEFQNV